MKQKAYGSFRLVAMSCMNNPAELDLYDDQVPCQNLSNLSEPLPRPYRRA
jgi:hypothetical protein